MSDHSSVVLALLNVLSWAGLLPVGLIRALFVYLQLKLVLFVLDGVKSNLHRSQCCGLPNTGMQARVESPGSLLQTFPSRIPPIAEP
jgi:hypothetical protein